MPNNRMPSMVALLGLLAAAGFQNRERIGKMIQANRSSDEAGNMNGQKSGQPGLFDEIGSIFGGTNGSASLSEAVSEIVERFRNAGQALVADSWVASGTNQEITPDALATTLGDDVVKDLVEKTGLTRAELLSRLARSLPAAVDQMTASGRMPSAEEAQTHL